MTSDFLARFAADEGLNEREVTILAAVDVRSAEDVDSLSRNFPSISDAGVRLPVISNAAAQNLSSSYSRVSAAVGAHQLVIPTASLGAMPAAGSPVTVGSSVGMPSQAPPQPSGVPATLIDLRFPAWPVRDQGQRGTCVSFGATACVEHLLSGGLTVSNRSEQFLYWSIKTHSGDPRPHQDGTWLEYARDMLITSGICWERFWPYVGHLVNPVSGATQADPSASATADAVANQQAGVIHMRRPAGAAAKLLQLLQQGKVAAISLPCFQDPTLPNGPLNWTTPVGWAYGRVLNPPPKSVVVGGHCVCVTGFVPDPNEPNGGYFVLRNSWGTAWASSAPTAGASYAPEPGYGEISASYVDSYCWELLHL